MDNDSVYCGRCGQATAEHSPLDLQKCRTALTLEPPRYCEHCRRRMTVQVTPTGWTARCSEHGEQHGG